MNLDGSFTLLILGIITMVVGILFARHFFSVEARLERRRRRSNTRVSSTARRPMVKLSVQTKDDAK